MINNKGDIFPQRWRQYVHMCRTFFLLYFPPSAWDFYTSSETSPRVHWIPLKHASLQELWHKSGKHFQMMKNPSPIKCIPHSWNCYVAMSLNFLMEPSAPCQFQSESGKCKWATNSNLYTLCSETSFKIKDIFICGLMYANIFSVALLLQ